MCSISVVQIPDVTSDQYAMKHEGNKPAEVVGGTLVNSCGFIRSLRCSARILYLIQTGY